MNLIKRYLLLAILITSLGIAAPASVYNTTTPINLAPGQTGIVWNAETPTPGNGTTAASQQVALAPGQGTTPFSVDGHFSGAPGAFEVDVQIASNDADTDYQTCSNCNITTVDATNQTFHLDAGLAVAHYVRLLMRSRTNSVTITARISR